MLKKTLYKQILAIKIICIYQILLPVILLEIKPMPLIFLKNNAYFFNLKSNIC